MAFLPVTILPALRPWRSAGVRVLLLDTETAAALRDAANPPKGQPARSPARSEARPPGKGAAIGTPRAAPERQIAPGGDRRIHRSQAEPAVRPDRVGPAVQAGAPAGGAGDQAVVPSHWLPFWRELLQRTPSRPKLLWTYPGLGRDLDGHADAEHGSFLRRLLHDMAMPKGSHAFWPLARHMEDANAPVAVDARHFLGGVAVLKPDAVLLLTGTPPPGLGLDALRLLQPALVGGRRFVLMPHVDQLIREQGQYVRLITFLKALLGPQA